VSILKIKNLTIAVAFLTAAFTTLAQTKNIDLLINFPEGGSVHKHSLMIAESLTSVGYNVNIVNTNNCVNHVRHLNHNKTRAAIYFYADSSHNEFAMTGCVPPVNDDTYLTTVYYRVNAICTSKKVASTPDMVTNLVNSKQTVTISAVTSTPPRVVEALDSWAKKPVKMIPYAKSSDAVRGVLGGDADFLYIGLTPAVSNNPELFCWATTNKSPIGTMMPLQSLAPTYKYSTIGSYWFIQSHALTGNFRNQVKQDLDAIFAQNKWLDFFASAHMVPGPEFKNTTATDILKNINNLK
jgi:hypothetical protein